ncbi:MAG: DMT family transporter [Lachnospiraceae bacterium]
MEKEERKAKAKLLFAMLIFGSIGVFIRFIPLASAWIACTRGLVGTVFLLLTAALSGKRMDKPAVKRNLLPLCLSGAAIGVNWILLFEAYRYTTVAAATLCYYMAPVLVIALSPLVLKEKLTAGKVACVLTALLGMLFVSGILEGGAPNGLNARGILFGLGAAALYATVMLTNRFLKEISSYDSTILQLGIAAATVLPYAITTSGLKEFAVMSVPQTFLLLAVGIVHTGVAYRLYFGSMQKLSAQTVAVYSYIDPAFAVVLSVVFLREETGIYGILGAVLILGSTLLGERKGKRV